MGWEDDRTDQSDRRVLAAIPVLPTLVPLFGARGIEKGKPVVLSPGETAIGRTAAPRTLQLEDPRVSRRHAVFEVSARAVVLRDLASSHGTFVNGVKLGGPRTLSDGELIRAGDSFLLFRLRPLEVRDAEHPAIVGANPAMAALRARIALIGPTDVNVLVLGESGTGKELVARAVHDASGRRGRFVAVNTSAIPEALAESQLFGHLPGAFTGAKTAHPGFFEQADGGTLFLDEIGEMPMPLQAKLLRVIEERAVVPIGATMPRPLDVRLVTATHRALEVAIERGHFRGDLWARLSDVILRPPALRERREDILPILERALGPSAPRLEPDLVEALLLYEWPYNVRELLKIATELRVSGASADVLTLEMIAGRLGKRVDPQVAFVHEMDEASLPIHVEVDEEREDDAAEGRDAPPPLETVVELYRTHDGNISRIARALGRSRRQVHRYLEAAGLRKKDE